jgi:hypothetical protein
MTDNTEFREDLKRTVRTNDPDPDELRAAAAYLEQTAERWDMLENNEF